jgi:hypothetical protein
MKIKITKTKPKFIELVELWFDRYEEFCLNCGIDNPDTQMLDFFTPKKFSLPHVRKIAFLKIQKQSQKIRNHFFIFYLK